MLKVIYTETGIYIELVDQTVPAFVRSRVAFAASVGDKLEVQAGWASILVADLPGVAALAGQAGIGLCVSDVGFIEVTLQGTWLSTDSESALGIFAVELIGDVEERLVSLWQASEEAQYSLME